MLDLPVRIFRCYICVENRFEAPLQDLSLLVEHLAKHFDFHLFECRSCKLKFVTPFLANFHIKEGQCKKEDGELLDDGEPPLQAVDLDSVEFESFCLLQNAITKCTELMLYELNYGDEDLLNCVCFSRERVYYPVSPYPIHKAERQMQTSPSHSETSSPSKSQQSSGAPLPLPSVPAMPSESAVSASTSGSADMELDDISEDEIEKVNNGGDEDRSAEGKPANSPVVVEAQSPAHSAPSTNSIPSLMDAKLNELVDFDFPPRHDIRQQVVIPIRSLVQPLSDYLEPDSSTSSSSVESTSSAATPTPLPAPPSLQPFFFQAPPSMNSRPPQPTIDLLPEHMSQNSRVNSEEVLVNDAGVYRGHAVSPPEFAGQRPPFSDGSRPFLSYRHLSDLGSGAPYCDAVPSTSCNLPPHERNFTNYPPVYSRYDGIRNQGQMPRRGSPSNLLTNIQFFEGYRNNRSPFLEEEHLDGRDFEGSFEDDRLDVLFDNSGEPVDSSFDFMQGEKHIQPRNNLDEWVGCAERPVDSHFRALNEVIHCPPHKPYVRRQLQHEKIVYSYAIRVDKTIDPHSGLKITPPEKERARRRRRSGATTRKSRSRERQRTTDLRDRAQRSRSRRVRISTAREELRSSHPRRSGSFERSPTRVRRGRSKSLDRSEIPRSVLHGDIPSTSSRQRTRSRPRQGRTDGEREEKEVEDERNAAVSPKPGTFPSDEDLEVLEVLKRAKARASQQLAIAKLSRFSSWKKRYIRRPLGKLRK